MSLSLFYKKNKKAIKGITKTGENKEKVKTTNKHMAASTLLVYMICMTVQLQSQLHQASQCAVVKQHGQLGMELTRLQSTAGVAVSPSTCTA